MSGNTEAYESLLCCQQLMVQRKELNMIDEHQKQDQLSTVKNAVKGGTYKSS